MFGIGHTYRGMGGVIQTSIMDLIFGAVFIFAQGLVKGKLCPISLSMQ